MEKMYLDFNQFRLSKSALEQEAKCGEAFRRQRVLGEWPPIGVAGLRGIASHAGIELNNRHRMDYWEDLELGLLHEETRKAFWGYIEQKGIFIPRSKVHLKEELLAQGLQEALDAVTCYREQVALYLEPSAVEVRRSTSVPWMPFPLLCIVDLTARVDGPIYDQLFAQEPAEANRSRCVLPLSNDPSRDSGVEFKTGRSWSQFDVDMELQPTIEAYLTYKETGLIFQDFIYFIFKTLKKGVQLQVRRTTRGPEDFSRLRAIIESFMERMEAGIWRPAAASGHWYCTPDWCPFWNSCRYVGN